jgi:uncharacterized protein YkwD
MNEARQAHGLSPLQMDRRLLRVARAHSRKMLRTGSFFHGAFSARIRAAGVSAPRVGENLGWSAGALGQARAIVGMWLKSSEHRANLLRPGYRTVGVGARKGTFDGVSGALVVTTDFAGS